MPRENDDAWLIAYGCALLCQAPLRGEGEVVVQRNGVGEGDSPRDVVLMVPSTDLSVLIIRSFPLPASGTRAQ